MLRIFICPSYVADSDVSRFEALIVWLRWQEAQAASSSLTKVRFIFSLSSGDILPTTSIVYFYLLDTIPLFIAAATYAIFWPGRWIEQMEDHAAGTQPKQNVPLQNYNYNAYQQRPPNYNYPNNYNYA